MGFGSVLIKYAAESAWCLLLIAPIPLKARLGRAMSFGFVRLLIGREAMLLVSRMVVLPVSEPLVYGVLVVGRWFAWTFLLFILSRSAAMTNPAFPARGTRNRWRLGGVLVSCLADVPALLTGTWAGVLWL